MEDLFKQVRSKFSGREEFGNTRNRSSFKGERKPQTWLKRQLSRPMSFKEPTEEAEYAAAVAAAAFAISSLEPGITDQRKPELGPGPQFSLPRIISGIVDRIAAAAEPGEASDKYAGERLQDEYQPKAEEMIPEKTIHPVPSVKRTPSMPKKRLTFAEEMHEDTGMPFNYIEKTPTFNEEELEDAKNIKPTIPFTGRSPSAKRSSSTKRSPSVRRRPSFGEEEMQNAKTTKQESPAPRSFQPSPIPPPPAVPPLKIQPTAPPRRAQQPRVGNSDADADAWEREQMAKIKERYEKLNATILEWEDKKRNKARRKLEMTENEPEKRRAKALQKYHIEMERIKQIADGARAQAKEKRRNEEFKVKEKANKYRATGEPPLPPMCLCL
ncbi:hypothetical protein BVRB_6g136990 isoform B [Beta vulgaris subsp. vulgaris]|nr:hypothetical protein BVRB_6g136990 isoform B [Beta vulgaris subsp. vulgaris]